MSVIERLLLDSGQTMMSAGATLFHPSLRDALFIVFGAALWLTGALLFTLGMTVRLVSRVVASVYAFYVSWRYSRA